MIFFCKVTFFFVHPNTWPHFQNSYHILPSSSIDFDLIIKQAGAELCQAQLILELVKPDVALWPLGSAEATH